MPYVYLLESESTGQFYIGYTKDLEKRVRDHQTGDTNWTSTRGPWKLRYYEAFDDDTEARKREIQLKRSRNKRYFRWLIAEGPGQGVIGE